ncbi:MAG: Bro-N domain-containing protein [Lachnospiraceae bacterium]|nr:Bro-N domain-containing protein [Lachnospiraceae bacterium]
MSPEELEFFDDNIRKVWHSQEEEWYISIVDVCKVLTDTTDAVVYWRKLKQRLKAEGNETVTNCHGLKKMKLLATDGKMRLTDCATPEGILRIVQSIPSKKAEPFKQWLAKVGAERLEEMADPEKALDRGMSYYRAKGYSEEWIKQRLQSKSIRDELTDEWKRVGISDSKDYAILTNILTVAWSGKTVQAYKQHKGLHKENLSDNMTNIELTLNQLAEVSTTALSKAKNPKTFSQSQQIAQDGGTVAKTARSELEAKLGHSVISSLNASDPPALEIKEKE